MPNCNLKNNGKKWTPSETRRIDKLNKEGKSTNYIAKKLQRTEAAIRNQAAKKKIKLSN